MESVTPVAYPRDFARGSSEGRGTKAGEKIESAVGREDAGRTTPRVLEAVQGSGEGVKEVAQRGIAVVI